MSEQYEDLRVIDFKGDGIPHPATAIYEAYDAEASLIDEVAGLVATRGVTACNYARIADAADVAIGQFNKQTEHQPLVLGHKSTNHAEDGMPVNMIGHATLTWFILAPSQDIALGTRLEHIDGGFISEYDEGEIVAIAAQEVATGEAEYKPILCWNLINRFAVVVVEAEPAP